MSKMRVEIIGLKLPLIRPGDNLIDLIVEAANTQAGGFRDGDILVITSKIVSIAEGYILDLNSIKPSKRAMKIARKLHMDPRFIQLILDLSDDILFVIPFRELVERGIVDEICASRLSGLDTCVDAEFPEFLSSHGLDCRVVCGRSVEPLIAAIEGDRGGTLIRGC